MDSASTLNNALNSAMEELNRINNILENSYTGTLSVPKCWIFSNRDKLIFIDGVIKGYVEGTNDLINLYAGDDFRGGGALEIKAQLLTSYRKWNNWYIQKKEGNYSGIYSRRKLRQAQEFYLTAYNNFLPEVSRLLEEKKSVLARITNIENQAGVVSSVTSQIREIVEDERKRAEDNLTIAQANSKIITRNILIYGLPLIALAIFGYLIFKRKIKLG